MSAPPPRALGAAVAQAVSLAVMAYFVFWACAPAATFPPPVPAPGDYNRQWGVALSGTSVVSPGGCTAGYFAPFNCGADIQAWIHWDVGRRLGIGGTILGGQTSIVGGSVDLRLRLKETETLRTGLSLRAGSMLAQVGGYVAGRPTEKLWLYMHPNAGFSFYAPLELPAGFSWQLSDKWALTGEVGVGFDPFGYASWETDSSLDYASRDVMGWMSLGFSRGF